MSEITRQGTREQLEFGETLAPSLLTTFWSQSPMMSNFSDGQMIDPSLARALIGPFSALREKMDRGGLVLQPKFQREYVCEFASRAAVAPDRVRCFLKIPIPPIYFGKDAGGRLEMIDGQQRLTTLIDFVSNKFQLRKLNRMASLNQKFFKDLSKTQQEKILDTPIRSIVIDAAGNADLRYEVFERLNRGSMALNEQELRNCVYRGAFNDLLAELERDFGLEKS